MSTTPSDKAIARVKLLDELVRFMECDVMPSPLGGCGMAVEHFMALLHEVRQFRDELARSAAAKGEG